MKNWLLSVAMAGFLGLGSLTATAQDPNDMPAPPRQEHRDSGGRHHRHHKAPHVKRHATPKPSAKPHKSHHNRH